MYAPLSGQGLYDTFCEVDADSDGNSWALLCFTSSIALRCWMRDFWSEILFCNA